MEIEIHQNLPSFNQQKYTAKYGEYIGNGDTTKEAIGALFLHNPIHKITNIDFDETDAILNGVLSTINAAEKVFQSDLSVETKYNLIFGMDIAQKIRKLGVDFDPYCPDTSYEGDIKSLLDPAIEFRDGELQQFIKLHKKGVKICFQ